MKRTNIIKFLIQGIYSNQSNTNLLKLKRTNIKFSTNRV